MDVNLHKLIDTLFNCDPKMWEWPNSFVTIVANVKTLLDIAVLKGSVNFGRSPSQAFGFILVEMLEPEVDVGESEECSIVGQVSSGSSLGMRTSTKKII